MLMGRLGDGSCCNSPGQWSRGYCRANPRYLFLAGIPILKSIIFIFLPGFPNLLVLPSIFTNFRVQSRDFGSITISRIVNSGRLLRHSQHYTHLYTH